MLISELESNVEYINYEGLNTTRETLQQDLETMGKELFLGTYQTRMEMCIRDRLIGGSGSGSVTKLANQIIVNNTIAVVSEAFVLAAKAGADPVKVYEAIRGGLAGSAVLDAKVPMIVERNFKP